MSTVRFNPDPKVFREPKKAKRLRPKSTPLTDAQTAVRNKVKERSGGWCEIGKEGVCTRDAVHHHHRLRRSQGGRDTVTNLLHLCKPCHDFTHAHPQWANEHGYLIRSGAK